MVGEDEGKEAEVWRMATWLATFLHRQECPLTVYEIALKYLRTERLPASFLPHTCGIPSDYPALPPYRGGFCPRTEPTLPLPLTCTMADPHDSDYLQPGALDAKVYTSGRRERAGRVLVKQRKSRQKVKPMGREDDFGPPPTRTPLRFRPNESGSCEEVGGLGRGVRRAREMVKGRNDRGVEAEQVQTPRAGEEREDEHAGPKLRLPNRLPLVAVYEQTRRLSQQAVPKVAHEMMPQNGIDLPLDDPLYGLHAAPLPPWHRLKEAQSRDPPRHEGLIKSRDSHIAWPLTSTNILPSDSQANTINGITDSAKTSRGEGTVANGDFRMLFDDNELPSASGKGREASFRPRDNPRFLANSQNTPVMKAPSFEAALAKIIALIEEALPLVGSVVLGGRGQSEIKGGGERGRGVGGDDVLSEDERDFVGTPLGGQSGGRKSDEEANDQAELSDDENFVPQSWDPRICKLPTLPVWNLQKDSPSASPRKPHLRPSLDTQRLSSNGRALVPSLEDGSLGESGWKAGFCRVVHMAKGGRKGEEGDEGGASRGGAAMFSQESVGSLKIAEEEGPSWRLYLPKLDERYRAAHSGTPSPLHDPPLLKALQQKSSEWEARLHAAYYNTKCASIRHEGQEEFLMGAIWEDLDGLFGVDQESEALPGHRRHREDNEKMEGAPWDEDEGGSPHGDHGDDF
eukprot:TRINITY_DN497_c0_g1_i1.p1 TRINITY_DN497_c0_g1~~TRINITY_DN497_c0_g1_i1.p1  ORF type:complete len:759 (-),score=136.06 TRINITY_DN497_c0_g1_i1:168-2222(-)